MMTDEEIKDELAKEESEETRIREILADGSKTEFWMELRKILEELMEEAKDALPFVSPERLSETQQMYKIPERIISIVEHYGEWQDQLDEELKKEFLEREGKDNE